MDGKTNCRVQSIKYWKNRYRNQILPLSYVTHPWETRDLKQFFGIQDYINYRLYDIT